MTAAHAFEADYVVVGAGSAGCALARRLGDQGASVLLVEAGGSDKTWKIQIPSAYAYPLADDTYSWQFRTEPQSHMEGRRIAWPAGKVLGGSSSINGMVYIRGNAMDFDGWQDAGADGWGYADVLPYFKRAETRVTGGDEYRGNGGPLTVSGPTNHTPLFEAFIGAGAEAGHGRTPDVNGYRQEGFGPYEMTVRKGVRCSAYKAYLDSAPRHPNIQIVSGARVRRILLDGSKAVGIEFERSGAVLAARAGREVILSAGAIHSPRLLMLSGIGPADALRAIGIPPVHDLRGVGKNLQDHAEIYVQFRCKKPVSLYRHMSPFGKLRAGLRWLCTHDGICATNHAEAGGFVRSGPDAAYPDIQFHFVPMAIDYHGNSPVDDHSFQVHVGPTRPTSRGWIGLRSADPNHAPVLQPDYLATDHDRLVSRTSVRLAREIMAQPSMREFCGAEISPGAPAQTDEALDQFIRRHAESGYHYAGTCRMGTDADAVVDPQARVHGLEGLRIADASIMPMIVNGNTNAAAIMIGEKAADHIGGRRMLAPLHLPFYRADPGTPRTDPMDTVPDALQGRER